MPLDIKKEYQINPHRLQYLLDLYKLSKGNFLRLLNDKRKRGIVTPDEINNILANKEKVDEPFLKRIDKIFNKGVEWYLSQRDIVNANKSSIFFRKDKFNSDIKFESIKIINKFEEKNVDIQVLSDYVNFKPLKRIKKYRITDDPRIVSREIYDFLNGVKEELLKKKTIKIPSKIDDRLHLKNLIKMLEHIDIFVFEHIDYPQKKNKVDFSGFFIKPNVIVIKKEKTIRREMFSLLHEFAHYVLEYEEIDSLFGDGLNNRKNPVEDWCNSFAFFFLLVGGENRYNSLSMATKENSYYSDEVEYLHKKTFLSYTALYTRLLIDKKIKRTDYNYKIEEIRVIIKTMEEEKRKKFKEENEKRAKAGKSLLHPIYKPIESGLFKELVKANYFSGNIGENALREHLNISSKKDVRDVVY